MHQAPITRQFDPLEPPKDYHFPPYITLAHLFHAPAGWAVRNRVMNQYVLQYVVDGVAHYPVEDYDYETRRGDLLVHRPNELHSILTVEGEPYVCVSIVFHFGYSPFPFDELVGGGHLLGNFADHPVDGMLMRLLAHYRQPGLADQVHCQSLLMQILTEAAVANRERQEQSATMQRNKAKLVLIKNHIVRHFDRAVTLGELEGISGLSRNYIIAQFKQSFGMTPMQYLTWIRIDKAKQLAIQTNLSVGEIASRVGYTDVHTFGKMFKKKTGTSLSQFCSALVTRPS